MTQRPFKIRYAIVCDDIRKEDNGKLILIGVYGHNIQVAQLPARLQLALILAVETHAPITMALGLKVKIGNRVLVGGTVSVEAIASGIAFVIAKQIPLPELTEEGTLAFQIRREGRRWETVCSLALERRRD